MYRTARSFAARSPSFEEAQADYRTSQVAHFGAPCVWVPAFDPKRSELQAVNSDLRSLRLKAWKISLRKWSVPSDSIYHSGIWNSESPVRCLNLQRQGCRAIFCEC